MRIFILVVCGVMLAAQHANAQRPQRTALTPSERAVEVALSDEALQFRYRSDGSIVNVKQGRLYAFTWDTGRPSICSTPLSQSCQELM